MKKRKKKKVMMITILMRMMISCVEQDICNSSSEHNYVMFLVVHAVYFLVNSFGPIMYTELNRCSD